MPSGKKLYRKKGTRTCCIFAAQKLRLGRRLADARQSTGLSELIFQVLVPLYSRNHPIPVGSDGFWQGHKDLNPEPTVLETAALPIELYPYISLIAICIEFVGGPSGT